MKGISLSILIALAVVATPAAYADDNDQPTIDAKAAKAYKQLVDSYRAYPALTVKTELLIEVGEGETVSAPEKREVEFTYSRGGGGIAKLNGFTCSFDDGDFAVTYTDADDSYFFTEYTGSPYWEFLLNFRDVPFPHIAMFWGEPEMEDQYMQLHSRSADLLPVSIESVTIEDRPTERIVFRSANAEMTLDVDSKDKLLRSAVHRIHSGPYVQDGATIVYKYKFTYQKHDEPLGRAKLMADQGDRRRVDMLASLMPAPEPTPPPLGGQPGGGAGPLVGQPAPAFKLALLDGGDVVLNDLRGEVVILDFWASWCGPCMAALPSLHKVADWVDDNELPVQVFTVNVMEHGDTPEARAKIADATWTRRGFSLPILMDYTDETAAAYGVRGIPTTIVIGPDGVVVAQHVGAGPTYADDLKAEIEAALQQADGDDAQ